MSNFRLVKTFTRTSKKEKKDKFSKIFYVRTVFGIVLQYVLAGMHNDRVQHRCLHANKAECNGLNKGRGYLTYFFGCVFAGRT